MKKVGGAALAAVAGAKLWQSHNKKQRHKNYELAKPYHPTMREDFLVDVEKNTKKGKKTCVIIGGGVAGVATAHALCVKGHNVILLERASGAGLECSSAPAGGMQRSNPTVDSSMWVAAFRSIFGLAPFPYFQIDFWETLTDPHYWRWFSGFSYNGAVVSDEEHNFYQKQLLSFTEWAIDDIISIMSKNEDIKRSTGLVQTGALKMFFDDAAFNQAKKQQGWGSNRDGEETVMLNKEEVLAIEPCLGKISNDGGHGSEQLVGGALQKHAASGSCLGYTTAVMKELEEEHKNRFHLESNVAVVGFDSTYGTISQIHTSRGSLEVPVGVDVVVAAGSWTPLLLRKLDLYCPVYPMKGYNLLVDLEKAGLQSSDFPSRIIVDDFIFSSTINNELRVASFGEFSGWSTAVNPKVARDLKVQAGRMYPTLQEKLLQTDELKQAENEKAMALPDGMEIKTGLRPFASDGRLLTGRVSEYRNLFVNVGPGFNGWKVATGSAKVLAADITGDSSDLPNSFDPDILSPTNRVKYSPWFCRVVDFFTYNY